MTLISIFRMFKALLALALTVNLAASLKCYSGMQATYSGCSGVSNSNTITSTDADDYAAIFGQPSGTYDTCVSYTYTGDVGSGCTYEQVVSTFTSSTLVDSGMDCDYYEGLAEANMAASSGTMSDWTCSTCTTDNCNLDATTSSTSGAGSLYASRTLACLSSFALALLLCRL